MTEKTSIEEAASTGNMSAAINAAIAPTPSADEAHVRTKEELFALAQDIRDGKVFGTWSLGPHDPIQSIFMVLVFMSNEHRDALKAKGVVHLYEYMNKAGSLAVNGYPTFFSCHTLTSEETTTVQGFLDKLIAADERLRAELFNS